MRRSHTAAISSPPPTQTPWILSDDRVAAPAERIERRVHDMGPYGESPAPCLAALGFANSPMSVAGENAFRRAAQNDAAQVLSEDSAPIVSPSSRHIVFRQRIEILGPVQNDGPDRPSRLASISRLTGICCREIDQRQNGSTRPNLPGRRSTSGLDRRQRRPRTFEDLPINGQKSRATPRRAVCR